jgi:murein DD-endopeptidase MepM/ murein hydrolase activator NlpD
MKRTIKLEFVRPVDAEINPRGGKYGAPRHYGPHKGVDFLAYLSTVEASEDGVVVFSDFIKRKPGRKGSYGETIVIDHTPEARENQRHLYSLYAHLEERSVHAGRKVNERDKIGISGNTGTSQWYFWKEHGYYKDKKRRGFHLHFEIIDSPKELVWDGSERHPLELRKNPMDYIGPTITIEYPLSEEEMKKIQSSVDPRPVIDRERGTCRVDWYVGGRKLGSTDKKNKEIDLKLTPEEVEEILRNPARPPKTEPKKLVYEIKI